MPGSIPDRGMEALVQVAGSMSDFDARILVEIGGIQYCLGSLGSTDLVELASYFRDAGNAIDLLFLEAKVDGSL
jgi:hypothetical protein